MRSSSTLDACGLALGVALLSLHVGEAFLCPMAVLGSSSRGSMTGNVHRQQQQQQQQQQRILAATRSAGRMAIGGEGGQGGDGGGLPCALPLSEDTSSTARKGPLRRLKSRAGRKTLTAAAVSALLSAGTPGRAEALFGRGKTPEPPPVPALEQRLQDGAEALEGAVEGLTDAAEGLGADSDGDTGAVVDGGATGLAAEGGVSLPTDQGTDGTIPSPSTSTTSSEGFQQEALAGVSSSPQSSAGGSVVAARKGAKGSAAGGEVVGALEAARGMVSENRQIAAVAIAGAAGATVVVSRTSGGRGGSSRGRKGSKRGAPRSPFAGIGKPRVSPEVAAADAKRKADSLKNVNFDVDLELFGDAVSDFPVRPPPPAPPAPEPVPSPSETIKGAMAARDAATEEGVLEAPTDAGSGVTVAAESAAELPPVEAPVEPEAKKQDKPKKKGSMMNLFKRDSGPQRSTTMDEAMCGETADVATFRQATAAVLARSAPQGAFDVRAPRALEEATTALADAEREEATTAPEDAEGEAEGDGDEAAATSSGVSALTDLMQTAGLSKTEAAEAVADVVNAMVVSLVDDAVKSKDEEATGKAADALLHYMDDAGALFVSLCPGVELKPQIKYNGSFKRGKLEKVFEAAARTSLKMGDEGQMAKLDRLQDLFSIKEAKASSITQKIMMELMMKMMSEGGGEDTEGLEKMMAAMGGGGRGGWGGMPGMGARSPEDHKQEVAALKAMVESGECPKEEVDGLRKMYKDAGMDIDTLVNDPMMESSMDADAKEVVVLLRKLLALWPKT